MIQIYDREEFDLTEKWKGRFDQKFAVTKK